MDVAEKEELLELCARYIRETRLPLPLPRSREEHERYQEVVDAITASEEADDAWWHLDHLTFNAPSEAWEVIRELVARTDDEEDLGTVGAGVLETFIHNHGNEWAEAIEQELMRSNRFLIAMRMVRGTEDHPQLRRRIAHFLGE